MTDENSARGVVTCRRDLGETSTSIDPLLCDFTNFICSGRWEEHTIPVLFLTRNIESWSYSRYGGCGGSRDALYEAELHRYVDIAREGSFLLMREGPKRCVVVEGN